MKIGVLVIISGKYPTEFGNFKIDKVDAIEDSNLQYLFNDISLVVKG